MEVVVGGAVVVLAEEDDVARGEPVKQLGFPLLRKPADHDGAEERRRRRRQERRRAEAEGRQETEGGRVGRMVSGKME